MSKGGLRGRGSLDCWRGEGEECYTRLIISSWSARWVLQVLQP